MKHLFALSLITLFAINFSSCKKKEDPTPEPDPIKVGDSHAGGIVIYVDGSDQHGIVITSQDLGEYVWSPTATDIGTTEYVVGTGKANTDEIVAAVGEGTYAAKVCQDLVLNGYDDWYLPSAGELKEAKSIVAIVGFDGRYWSSYEDGMDSEMAWFRQMGPGLPALESYMNKTHAYKVRAVRNF